MARSSDAGAPAIEYVADDTSRVRDILDLQEGRWPVPLLDDAGAAAALRDARRIAVVGASPNPVRPSNGVMRTLLAAGYDCVPVNPNANEVLGRPCFATVQVAVGARVLWLQLGVVSWEAARIAHEGGLDVVMDRCTAIELRRLR